jgi:hypothetical protein
MAEKDKKQEKRTKLVTELGELNYKAIGIKQAMVDIEKGVAEIVPEIHKLD